jgi:prolyl-tRNA editing enzyme YbaK/EbsC (Cys-tRNA(Pro) deacylase)
MRDRVMKAAEELGLHVNVRSLESPTRTVAEAAAAVGADEAQIAKSIVFVVDGEPIVSVTSGAHRVDVDVLAEAFDCAVVRQASPEEVRAATGFSVGGVPPFGHDLPVVFDEALLIHERIYAAAGDGNTLFEIDPRTLAETISARVLPVGEQP